MATLDEAQVLRWLNLLYRDAPGLVHLCAAGAWRGETFTNDPPGHAAALAYAARMDAAGREGVYARVSTLAAPLPPEHRGGAHDTAVLPALWADIDLAGPGHATPAGQAPLPDGEAAGRAIVTAAGLPDPTAWIHSGGGLYPLWLLDPPPQPGGPEGLARLATLSADWQAVLGAAAAGMGLHYGTGVGDLARVLRLPGSVNRKAGLQRPCRVLSDDGPRYRLPALQVACWRAAARWLPDPMAPALPPATEAQSAPRGERRTLQAVSEAYVYNGHQVVSGGIGMIPERHYDGQSPGDAFAEAVDWADILTPHGWRLARQRGSVRQWWRPGKQAGTISATTNALGTDRLRVFSTNAYPPFEARSYGKLGALALLEHGGDLSAAAHALQRLGYGARVPTAEAAATWPATQRALVGAAPTSPPPPPPGPWPGGPPAPGGPQPSGPPRDGVDDMLAEVRFREEVAAEARRLRIRREAARRLDDEDYEAGWREPPSTLTLAQELELPDEDLAFRVADMLPAGGNALIAAQFKAGKTTLCNELVRSLADGTPFLGRFDVERPDGRVALFNYEVSPGQYRRWLRELGIEATDRVCVLNVRGFRLPPTVAQVEAWITKWLADRDVAVWVVDPFARAFTGAGEENSNSDVGVFLDRLDSIKEQAGVGELILPVHTGRAEQDTGQERARGATRLDDWADARWLLTVDDAQRRYLRASGRDVDVPEARLTIDPTTRRLTLGGPDRQGARLDDLVEELVAFVADTPGAGVNEIADGVPRSRNRVVDALHRAIGAGRITYYDGPGRRRQHYASESMPSIEECN